MWYVYLEKRFASPRVPLGSLGASVPGRRAPDGSSSQGNGPPEKAMAPMSTARIKLVFEGPWGNRTVHLGPGGELTVGRGKASDLRIHDDRASRVHCRITRPGPAAVLEVEDLNSSNGTFVNGRPTARGELVPGDRVEIGATTVRVEDVDDDEATTRIARPPEARAASSDRPREIRRLEGQVEHLARNVERFKTLLEINRSLITELDKDRLWERIIDTAIELTRAERGFLIIFKDGEMVFEVARNLRREEVSQPEYEVSRSIARQVASEDRALITANAEEDERFQSVHSVAKLKLRSILCVPLRQAEQSIGALYFDNRFEEGLFTDEDRYLLEAFAAQATLALNNADMFAALKRSRDEIATLNRALEGQVATQRAELKKVRRVLKSQQDSLSFRYNYSSIVGRSPAMARVLKTLDRITPTNLPVLVVGESGTGKELIARAIHFNSPRSGQPFVSENCAAIPPTLFESELFGYVQGAFTGADQDREGLIELASGGTLFLDEIGDLDFSLQKKLLRVLQEGEIRRLGDKQVRKVDVRVVSATNRNLEQLIHEKRFREDLYFRLCGVAIHLPPLRARTEDIPPLVDHFIRRIAAEETGPTKRVDSGALRMLMGHRWPGNVRELENELRRAWHLAGSVITPEDLSPAVGTGQGESIDRDGSRIPLREAVDRLERQMIEVALQEFGGNKSKVARELGLSRVGLRKKMVRLGLIDSEEKE